MTHKEVMDKFKHDAGAAPWLKFFAVGEDGSLCSSDVPESELSAWLTAAGGCVGFAGGLRSGAEIVITTRPFDDSPRTATLLDGAVRLLSGDGHAPSWTERTLLKIRDRLAARSLGTGRCN